MAQIEALKVTTSGDIESIQIDSEDSLQGLYTAIDCTNIEYLSAKDNIDLVIDGEGKLTGQERNTPATMLAVLLGFVFLPGDYIAGDVVFVADDGEGGTVGLSEEQRKLITGAFVV
ncbi:DUF3846 domain-containing protein [Glutamicibacter ardleyensis]|uniref:DUF3846 domain-containing protein n=1 Tax=Glutamicibacter ardleyensis TaxID=225894 RepID=UPI003FCF8AD7